MKPKQEVNTKRMAEDVNAESPVIVEARIVKWYGCDKYCVYDIIVIKVNRNLIATNLDSPLKVTRVNYEIQPELNKIYTLNLDYYNKAHPEYGLKIAELKEK
jgi:hypothetical protein